jgi:hypothetical protein
MTLKEQATGLAQSDIFIFYAGLLLLNQHEIISVVLRATVHGQSFQ